MASILLTGATGFLGRHARPVLEAAYGAEAVAAVSSAEYDLMDHDAVEAMFMAIKPEAVVHFAAYTGGIGTNRKFPADFYYVNTLLTAHVFEAAARHRVRKLVYPVGSCAYPTSAASPLVETELWNGYPAMENAGYSMAKKSGIVAGQAYRSQHGLDATVIVCGNLYGEYSNFTRDGSQVASAMIRRYYDAKVSGASRVEMWGTGKPLRDFVHGADIARLIPFFIDSYHDSNPINVATGRGVSIRELAETIAELIGFKGEIFWDSGKPDGHMAKVLSVARLESLGMNCPTGLHEGLSRTVRWFLSNVETGGDGIRL